MNPHRWLFCVSAFVSLAAPAVRADIYRWDTGEVIPGTDGITPGPGVTLGRWDRVDRNLRFADFAGGLQLSSAVFQGSWLDNADFSHARLESAYLRNATLTSSKFTDSDLSHADLEQTKLTNADFTGAIVTGTSFGATGLTKEQLYSTASYKQNTLQGIKLWNNDLSAWNFSGQDLSASDLSGSALTGAIFDDAIIAGAGFAGTGFTQQQMYSTASYRQKMLQGIRLGYDLSGWNLSEQDLTGAVFRQVDLEGADLRNANLTDGRVWANLTNANLSGANLTRAHMQSASLFGANLSGANVQGATFDAGNGKLTQSQLYSTASYEGKDLRGIYLLGDLTGWNFFGQNLVGARFDATLTNADLTDAVVQGALFHYVSGFTKEQLYSTASYKSKNLAGIGLLGGDLSGWNFREQNLLGAFFGLSTLTNADLTDTVVRGAEFSFATSRGFTKGQLYATASYKNKDLGAISFVHNDLSGWNFSGQNLTGANLNAAKLTSADFSFADLRLSGGFSSEATTIVRNTILPDGMINGLNLAAGEKLVAFSGVPIPVKITGNFSMASTTTFDLTDNAAIVDYTATSPVATLRAQIISGRGGPGLGGAWTGTGITSSTAAAANATEGDSRSLGYAENTAMPLGPYSTFHGAPVDDTSALLAFTRTGDANLDGVVNDDDVTIVGATYAPGVPQSLWALGDFDYNGFVDDDDVTLFGAFYDPSAAPLVSGGVVSGEGVAAVPEPATLLLAAIATIAPLSLLRRRR